MKHVLDVRRMIVTSLDTNCVLLASVLEQVNICFDEAYNRVNWDQVFQLCQEKLRNTDSYGLCPLLPLVSAEMGAQEDRHKKLMKESLIEPYTSTNF